MTKGFTVKAKSPKVAKEPEWDYAKAKEMVKGKTVVFCLPGRNVSYTFLKSFVQLCFDLVQAGASIQISQDYSSMVNFARCKCLGANVLRGPDQKPWDGKLPYDWQLWIDSDIVFNSEKFWQLVLMEQDIAAGWYMTEDGKTTSVAHWLEEDDFRTNGGVMNHETGDSIGKRKKPFTVDYTGFGWLLIKNGVLNMSKCHILGLLQRCKSLRVARFRTCVAKMSHSAWMQRRQVSRSGAILAYV